MAKTKKQRQAAEVRRQATRRAAAQRGKITLAAWDHGAMGAANRVGLVVEDRGDCDPETGKVINPNQITGARRVDLLDFWANRGTISPNGLTAAKALRSAYEATMKGPPALPDNDRVQSSPKPDQSVTIRIERISRYSALMKLVHSDDRAIISLCVLDGGHPSRLYGNVRFRDGFAHLRAALDRLYSAMSG